MSIKHRLIIEELSPGYRVIVFETTTWLKYGQSTSRIEKDKTVEDWRELFHKDFPKDKDHAAAIKLALQLKQAYRVQEIERKSIN